MIKKKLIACLYAFLQYEYKRIFRVPVLAIYTTCMKLDDRMP